MWCVLVFYLVATICVVVFSMPEPCVLKGYWNNRAYCGKDDVNYTFNFIPPVSKFISCINMTGQPLKQLPYNAFRNVSSQSSLYEITLRHCEISHVDAGALLNLHNLHSISLSYNDIKHIDSKLFSHSKQMEIIDMEHNKIEVLPRGMFENLTLLEMVFLNDNRIHQVENYSFKNTPSLWNIDLSNNTIEFMSILFKDKFDKLTFFSLSGNPWKCDCELGPLYAFLIKINRFDQSELECEKPPALHGRNWSDISRNVFVCHSEDATSVQDSVMTSTELSVTNGVILKLDKEQGINRDAESVNIEDETLTSFEKPKTESSDTLVTKGKPETRMEISDITQRPLIIHEKQDEGTNNSESNELISAESDTEAEDSIKTPQESVNDQIVTTTTEISFNNHEDTDTNVQSHFNDLKWLPWILFPVAIFSVLGCGARYTFIRYRRKSRTIPSVRRTDQLAEEEASVPMYFQMAQQANC